MDTLESLHPPKDAVKSSTGYTWLDESGIIVAVSVAQDLHTLENAVENHEIIMKLSGGIRHPFLIDMSNVKSMSKEARTFYAGTEPQKAITAVAILTKSNIGKVVANFFLKLTRQVLPTKMFTDLEEARGWLMQYK